MKNAIELNKIFPERVAENEVPVMILNFETDEIMAEWMLQDATPEAVLSGNAVMFELPKTLNREHFIPTVDELISIIDDAIKPGYIKNKGLDSYSYENLLELIGDIEEGNVFLSD